MIELAHVSKTYITKSKRKVCALNDVTLRLPERGLCVLTGPSGCGKTTLLNIIGGLDNKFEGEYFFLDKHLSSDGDYARLRRDYIGFVFQDCNLVADLTVGDNLSLGYKFTCADGTDKVKHTLSLVGLSGYEERYPSELSGGEQQRIAIARALLKECSLLLADEPTGNLDKKTGREIYNLLKEISKDKLVIVVSHDEDLGKEFADYTVFLENGTIISQNLPTVFTERSYEEKKQKAISNKVSIKMAWHEYCRKKSQAIINTVLMILCFMMLSFSVGLFQYNDADVHYRLITDQNYEYFQCSKISGTDFHKYFASEGLTYIKSNYDTLYITSKKAAEQYGIKFYESDKTMEMSANVYYLSDRAAMSIISRCEEAYINGEKVYLDAQKHKAEDLIGAVLPRHREGLCGGIYYSDRFQALADDPVLDFQTLWKQGTIDLPYLLFENNGQRITVTSNKENILPHLSIRNQMYRSSLSGWYLVLTDTGEIKTFRDNKDGSIIGSLKDGETYLSLDTYNKLFGTDYTGQYLLDVEVINESLDFTADVKMMPIGIGSNLGVKIYNDKTYEELSLNGIKVKGIILGVRLWWDGWENCGVVTFEDVNEDKINSLYINDMDLFEQCIQYDSVAQMDAWIKTDSVKDLKSFIRGIYKSYRGSSIFEGSSYKDWISTPFTKYEFDISCIIDNIKLMLLLLGIPLLTATVLVLNLTVSAQIKNRMRELGIFKALGAQNKDLLKIYVFELLLVAVPIMLFTILGAWSITVLLSTMMANQYYPQLRLLHYGWTNLPITFVGGIVLILFAVLAPLCRIVKLNVIEAIRSS